MNAGDLNINVIYPVLKYLGLDRYIEAASQLLLGTIAVESNMGQFTRQIGGGPALGICQMEPATHDDIWDNFLLYRMQLAKKVLKIEPDRSPESLVINPQYAVVMARLQYYRSPYPLPKANDIEGMAKMWKKVYNTPLGKGTVEKFIEKYNKYVPPDMRCV